jgi:iron complex outermembrane recepter protein
MCRRAGILSLAIFASVISLYSLPSAAMASSPATSMIKSHFDLPAEPLDKALRDLAVQANCNISYEPAIVAGLFSPAVSGDFTVEDALSLLLKGTSLRVVNVNADTIQILEKPRSTTQASESRDRKDLEEIVVTGTHLRGELSASPVIELGREEIERSGFQSLSDLMLSVPQNFGGGYNPGTAVGNNLANSRYADNPTGASIPNLRGLGPGSTLTLIDGHRMASGLTGGGADISSIPLDAIDRVEIVTDSASSIYGSDAVAGVVNIILKKDYDGAKTSLTYGVATQGGGTERRASQLFGTNWTGGNAVVAYEFDQHDAVDASDRAFSSSTPGPFSLLPQTKSNSLTLSSSQDFSAATTAFIEGLFVARDANSVYTNPGLESPFENPSTLRRYAVTLGIDSNPGADWKSSVFVNAAEDATENDTSYLGPSLFPAGEERLLGILGNVEVNANGRIATLPSGPVRLALGAGYRKESFSDLFGNTGGPFNDRTDGRRNVRYAFGEASIPLAEHSDRVGLNYADLVLSVRSERYSDFGEKTVPKVGLEYAPTESVKLRTTWGQAFRAPNLYDLNNAQALYLLDLTDPASPSGISPVMIRDGGNPNLKPETAESWTVGLDYSPMLADGLKLSTTFFDIKYTNRISQLANPYAALTDPASAFFVQRSPSPSLIQSVYDSYPANQIVNATGGPFDINSTAAIVEYQLVNVASQTARGADLTASYKIGTDSNGALFYLNGGYLDLTQQDTPESPTETLSGLAFYPAKLRLRGGASWKLSSWALAGTVNYLPRETDTEVDPAQSVGSWTTMDASVRYSPSLSGFFSGLHFSLAAINLFNRNPPRVLVPPTVQGIYLDYDSSNASPLGRFISLSMNKEW